MTKPRTFDHARKENKRVFYSNIINGYLSEGTAIRLHEQLTEWRQQT